MQFMVILMADIVGSSKRKGKALMADFKAAVVWVNDKHKKQIASPLTITLGDEFQGVIKTSLAAFCIVFDLEEYLMKLKKPFKLRYVIHEGEIETEINKKIAYEMLGPGLTMAREELITLKSNKNRFRISLKDESLTEKLSLSMVIYQGIVDQWTEAQQKVVSVFATEQGDYRKVAERLKKDPTVMWRRKRSLMIDEINSLKKLILLTIDPAWQK